jgi:hypothetical protein
MGRRQLAQELGDTTGGRAIEIVELLVDGASPAHPDQSHPTLLALRTSIMIDQFVASDADHPRHRLQLCASGSHRRDDGGERLLCQVFGERSIT